MANHLILLIPKLPDVDDARKTWCGKYLIDFKIKLDIYDNYAK